jgi:hypothetical protein
MNDRARILLNVVTHRSVSHERHGLFWLSDWGTTVKCTRKAGVDQGCSTLFEEFHIGEGFDPTEGYDVSILGDGVGLIEVEDIVGGAAQPGEDTGSAADTRGVLAQGDVAGIVRLAFDAQCSRMASAACPAKIERLDG